MYNKQCCGFNAEPRNDLCESEYRVSKKGGNKKAGSPIKKIYSEKFSLLWVFLKVHKIAQIREKKIIVKVLLFLV